ncbi:predicted protein [Naegleria gruberi]|uniref:Predicted protein n=1 Tax=Naegleria gruberi TaxID=5762 RepID=D2V972_NAEGR|nr:uncharacterized protein NAEGRDRAFT_65587 [Naegleria gruberi]EFC46539.1 predicted protein [Naegleria gruberi]|eukprot:XP_002679283.1 predicted protein [Naegleria gruberi strain NEG-M]
MKLILIALFAVLACLVALTSCEHTIKTKQLSKDSLVLESTNSNEDTIEFMFNNAEHFPLIGVKLVRQAPTSTNQSSSQQASQSGSQSQQSGSQSSSQTTQPQPQSSTSQMQQEQANGTVSASQQQQQQSNASSQAASQQSSQSSNQTQTVEKQDNPQAQSTSQAGSQGTGSSSQATTPQSGNQNSTASSTSTSQSSQQGSSSSSQSTAQTNPVSQDNSSISGDTHMDLTPNVTQSVGQGNVSSTPSVTNVNTTLINETLQNIGISNSTASKDINITDIIGRIISGENITEIINSTLRNLTQWLNSTLSNDTDDSSQTSQQSKRGSLRRRLLSLLEENEENENYAQYLKFNKLKLMSSEGETVKEIPLSDANIHWNYGHSVVVNNEQAFKVPHVDVEIPLSSSSNRPSLKIRTMMTEAPSHIERNGRDIQLNPRSMDIQITLNNLHDLLSEKEKKLSGAKWTIETELTSTTNSLHLMQTKNLNGVQRVVVMGNNFTPKGQFTFNSSPNMKVIQDSDNDDLISIQIQDSSNSIQLNPIKFGVQ